MSQTTLKRTFYFDDQIGDPDTVVLSNRTGTFGVRRTDTDAVVVADGTAMTRLATGVYAHTWTDPADLLTYEYYIEYVSNGATDWIEGTIRGGSVSSVDVYDLSHLIVPFLPGCPMGLIKQHIRRLGQQFCRRTEVWRKELDTVASVEDQEEYDLVVGFDAFVHRVTRLRVDETDYSYSVPLGGTTVKLDPALGNDDLDIDISVVLVPKDICSQIDSWVLERWGWVIADGVVAALKSVPNSAANPAPWSDPKGAREFARSWQRGICEAKREVMTSRAQSGVRNAPADWS